MYNITDWTAGMTHFIKDHALKVIFFYFSWADDFKKVVKAK